MHAVNPVIIIMIVIIIMSINVPMIYNCVYI